MRITQTGVIFILIVVIIVLLATMCKDTGGPCIRDVGGGPGTNIEDICD